MGILENNNEADNHLVKEAHNEPPLPSFGKGGSLGNDWLIALAVTPFSFYLTKCLSISVLFLPKYYEVIC